MKSKNLYKTILYSYLLYYSKLMKNIKKNFIISFISFFN